MLDPKTKKVLHKLGSLCLMTQHHEMQMAGIVRDAGGEMTFNGAPRTSTWRTFAQQGGLAGGSRSAFLHEVENSEESRTVPCTIDLSRTRFCSLPFTPTS